MAGVESGGRRSNQDQRYDLQVCPGAGRSRTDSRQQRQDRLSRRIPQWTRILLLLAMGGGSPALPARAAEVASASASASAPAPLSAPGKVQPWGVPGGPVPLVRAAGRHFVDPAGRVVILRGVSLGCGAKVPPFQAIAAPSDLDPLACLGFNVIRVVFVWEAYEPCPGCYDEQYLARVAAVAAAAWERGLYVIVDFHQDGFSRYVSRGCGCGFPAWAISPRARHVLPDNNPGRALFWPFLVMTDPAMHGSFHDFYADVQGVRTRYLEMVARVSQALSTVPGVIGYDLLNEPWGREVEELAPLYLDAAGVIQARHPSALLFLEGHVTTNMGLQTKLPRLAIANLVYAPHYYKPLPIVLGRWHGGVHHIDRAFAHMNAAAEAWNAPLFLGEFGMPADVANAGAYVATIYDRLDACLASGAQWNYTPTWTEHARDGWNGENFNILNRDGTLRANFRLRPYPRVTAGLPRRFVYHESQPPVHGPSLEFVWDHCPECGATELFVPAWLFPPGSAVSVEPADVACRYEAHRQVLVCTALHPTTILLRLTGPLPSGP
jgi:endoglycosylceramidase